jgi:hypothetical protein
MNVPSRKTRRPGALAPLAALLLIPLVAMIAFAVDLGYVVQVKTDLQYTADAAALAGVQQLMQPYARWVIPSNARDQIRREAVAAAKEAAQEYAAYNHAGGIAINLHADDVECGFLDEKGRYNPEPPADTFPNTVRIVARRDGRANALVNLFFAPVLGTNNISLSVTAQATTYTGQITGLKKVAGYSAGLLPMAYDVAHWDAFVRTGQDPEGKASTAADGTPQIQVYPSVKFKGNFGELALDDNHAGASEIRDWINNGLPPNGLQNLLDEGLVPLSKHDKTLWDWLGNPGFKASTVKEVNDNVGKTYLLPLFKAKNSSATNYEAGVGQGSKYSYNIVRFVPITIMPPNQSNKEIVVQPSGEVDPLAEFDLPTVVPAGSGAETIESRTTFTTPKLTQ